MSISPQRLFVCAVLAAGLVLYTDHLTFTPIGTTISYAVVLAAIVIGIADYRFGVLSTLFVLLTFPPFPRNILDLYQDLNTTGGSLSFQSPKYIIFGGFSLIIWMFVALAALAVVRGALEGFHIPDAHVARMLAFSTVFLTLLLSAAFLDSLVRTNPVNWKEIVSDLRFPLLISAGAIVGHEFIRSCKRRQRAEELLMKLLIFVTLISGFKVVFFIMDDRFSGGLFRLSFANPFVFMFPLVLTLVWAGQRFGFSRSAQVLLVCFGIAGSLPDGRGPILTFVIEFIGLFFLVSICEPHQLPRVTLRSLGVVCVIGLLLVGVAASNQRLWGFLMYKSEFLRSGVFYRQLEKSPAIRIAEFDRIVSELSSQGVGVVIGKGAGAAFTYRQYHLPWKLDRSDYSSDELSHGYFYHPHTFISFWLLKGGITGLALYVGLFGWMGFVATRRMRTDTSPLPVFMAVLVPASILEAYWQPELVIVIAILFTVLAHERQSEIQPDN